MKVLVSTFVIVSILVGFIALSKLSFTEGELGDDIVEPNTAMQEPRLDSAITVDGEVEIKSGLFEPLPEFQPEDLIKSEEQQTPEWVSHQMEVVRALTIEQRNAAKASDWETFIEKFEEKMVISEIYAFASLGEAIKFNAPIYVFEDLLNKGAKFIPPHTSILAMTGNVELMIELEKMGLDIHAVNGGGENALNAAVRTMRHRKMFRYLLFRSVEPRPYKTGQTLLNMALERTVDNKEGAYFVYYLITSGMEMDQTGKNIVRQMSFMNEEAYSILTEKLPMLEVEG